MKSSKPKVCRWDINIETKAIVHVPVGDGEYMYHEFEFHIDDGMFDVIQERLEEHYEITE